MQEMQRNGEKWREMQRNAAKFREMQRNSGKCREMQRNVEKYREIQRHAEFLECLDTFKKYCWQPWDPINHKENYPGYFHCLFAAETHYC